MRVWADLDGDDGVALAARSLLALAGETDSTAALDALGKLQVEGLAAGQRHALLLEGGGIDERDFEPIGNVGALLRSLGPATEASAAASLTAHCAAEQPLEQIG